MANLTRILVTMGVAASLLVGAAAKAQDEAHLKERERILKLIEKVDSTDERRATAVKKGSERISFCSHCHGEDGNSKRPEIPNLAGQNPAYLLEQWDLFADGKRKNFVMQTLAKEFTLEDKINIAVYYSHQEPAGDQAIDEALATKGKKIFEEVCQFCHGPNGKGEQGYARLAGQQIEYVKLTLQRYRKNANSAPDPNEIKRTNPRMEQVTQNLSDADIAAVAHYIASLN